LAGERTRIPAWDPKLAGHPLDGQFGLLWQLRGRGGQALARVYGDDPLRYDADGPELSGLRAYCRGTGLAFEDVREALELVLGRRVPAALLAGLGGGEDVREGSNGTLPGATKRGLAQRLGRLQALACCGQSEALWRVAARTLAALAAGGCDELLDRGARYAIMSAFLDGYDQLEDWRAQRARAKGREPCAADRGRAENARSAARQRLERELEGVGVERQMGLRAASTLSPMLQCAVSSHEPGFLARLGGRLLERRRPVSGLEELKQVMDNLGEREAEAPALEPTDEPPVPAAPPDLPKPIEGALNELCQQCQALGWRAEVLLFPPGQEEPLGVRAGPEEPLGVRAGPEEPGAAGDARCEAQEPELTDPPSSASAPRQEEPERCRACPESPARRSWPGALARGLRDHPGSRPALRENPKLP